MPQRRWDIASGEEVRQVAASEIASGEEKDPQRCRTKKHLLTASGNILRITPLLKPKDAGDGKAMEAGALKAPAAIACFKAPTYITSVQCHGTTILVMCVGSVGWVHLLHAPFLVEPNQ